MNLMTRLFSVSLYLGLQHPAACFAKLVVQCIFIEKVNELINELVKSCSQEKRCQQIAKMFPVVYLSLHPGPVQQNFLLSRMHPLIKKLSLISAPLSCSCDLPQPREYSKNDDVPFPSPCTNLFSQIAVIPMCVSPDLLVEDERYSVSQPIASQPQHICLRSSCTCQHSCIFV